MRTLLFFCILFLILIATYPNMIGLIEKHHLATNPFVFLLGVAASVVARQVSVVLTKPD